MPSGNTAGAERQYRAVAGAVPNRDVEGANARDYSGSYPAAPVPDYADENVSTKVVKIIQSYTGIVDRMVWRKY